MQENNHPAGHRKRPLKVAVAGAAAGAVATVALFGTAVASPSQSSPLLLRATTTTEAMIRPCSTCARTHPAGKHIGGFDIQSGNVSDQHGTRVGHFALLAVGATAFTQHAPGELMLDVTLVLKGGQIAAHGVELPPDNSGTIAITGGTGDYRTARGELHFTDINQTTTKLQVTISK
jgi:hypothetical protein